MNTVCTTDGIVVRQGSTVYNAEGEAYTFVAMFETTFLCRPIIISIDEDGEEFDYKVNQIVPLPDVWSKPPCKKMHNDIANMLTTISNYERSQSNSLERLKEIHKDINIVLEKYREVMTLARAAEDLVRREKLSATTIALQEHALVNGAESKVNYYQALVKQATVWQVIIERGEVESWEYKPVAQIEKIRIVSFSPREGSPIRGKLSFNTKTSRYEFFPFGALFKTEQEARDYAQKEVNEYAAKVATNKTLTWRVQESIHDFVNSLKKLNLEIPEILTQHYQEELTARRASFSKQIAALQKSLDEL